MELSEDLEALYRQLALKKYKGTLTEDEALIFADLTDQRSRIDQSSAALGSMPQPLVNFMSDLGGLEGTMSDMAHKIRAKESYLDVAQGKKDEEV
ncbi:MAG: hypothetical protein K1Y36_06905 [Blastocatellia bacterium]|nr:hypothetical protein [Blastocatellia bacterium]